MRFALTLWCLLLALPVGGVLASWLVFDTQALAVLEHQARTVLGGYALQSLLLALGVAVGTAALDVATAVAVGAGSRGQPPAAGLTWKNLTVRRART